MQVSLLDIHLGVKKAVGEERVGRDRTGSVDAVSVRDLGVDPSSPAPLSAVVPHQKMRALATHSGESPVPILHTGAPNN